MGFAAVQSEHIEQTSAPLSALEQVQGKLIGNIPVGAADIHGAIKQDIESGTPFNLTILTKALTSRRIQLHPSDIDRLAVTIRDAMATIPLGDYEIFINYAQAAVICVRSKDARNARG
jgi:hypothetical protein